jgi:hypothetical protein
MRFRYRRQASHRFLRPWEHPARRPPFLAASALHFNSASLGYLLFILFYKAPSNGIVERAVHVAQPFIRA